LSRFRGRRSAALNSEAPGLSGVQHNNDGRPEQRLGAGDLWMATTSDLNGIPELQRRYSRADHPIKGIISDLDGVAYRDDNPIPGSVQAFGAWHERGAPYAFVTNNSTKFAAKLSGMGIRATATQVFRLLFLGGSTKRKSSHAD
jgi:4-nitrophenyl phosphatase